MGKPASSLLYMFSALLFLLSTTLTKGNPNGLTLKLIHRDSPESPLFAGNFTAGERQLRMVQQTLARASLLAGGATSNVSTNALTRASLMETCTFMINVGVGTFPDPKQPNIPYFLGFDTGSATTWLQSEGCRNPGNQCFEQEPPLFPSSRSTTFKPVLCQDKHSLCDPAKCQGQLCRYTISYYDGSVTKGVMARDVFTFAPGRPARRRPVTQTLMFGCGQDQRGFVNIRAHNSMAGVMGAGWGSNSVITQLGNRANGRFSYCIPIPGDGHAGFAVPSTFIRFGADAVPPRRGDARTALFRYGRRAPYFVNMVGVSLAGERLPVDAGVFRPHKEVEGAVVDSGSELSVMVDPAFEAIRRALRARLRAEEIGEMNHLEVCFKRPPTMRVVSLPALTLHFEGGDMVIRPENVFMFEEANGQKYFCLAMLKSPVITLVGAYQQRNQRFTYDIARRQLSFGPETCRSGA